MSFTWLYLCQYVSRPNRAMSEEFKLSIVAGGKPLPTGSLFAPDGRHFLVPFNNQLRVYFITTRQCIRSVMFDDVNNVNFDTLVEMRHDTENGNLVWAFFEDGEVLIINWKEKLTNPVLKRFSLSFLNKDDSILKVVSFKKEYFTVVTGKQSTRPHTRSVMKYTIKEDDEITSDRVTSIKNVILFSVSKDSNKIVCLSQNKKGKFFTVVDVDLSTPTAGKKTQIPFPYKALITSMAISNDSTVAAGTAYGVIHLFYKDSSRVLKWHIDHVKSLSFSKDNNYLLSGGLERVLVFWQLSTEKQQFLPRLNGEISHIDSSSDEHYTLTLKLDNQDNFEILVLSAVDLQSRLSVAGPRQGFNSDLSNIRKLQKTSQKNSDIDVAKVKYDFTSIFRVHPTTRQMYFLNGTNLQVFDSFKNEQILVQKITDTLQTGKVKSETKLLDPVVTSFAFTADGKWLATVEEHQHGEIDNLMSKHDLTYVLKIWKSVELQTKQHASNSKPVVVQTSWELITKIVNPHGLHIPVLSLIAAPSTYHKGIAFLTADNNGGVRLWRSNGDDERSQSWSLRKLKPSTGILFSSISLKWSEDSSLIFLGIDSSIIPIDTNTFEEIETEETSVLANITGSRIRYLDIVDNHLIVFSKTVLKSINLLTMEENDLIVKVNTPKKGENLISVDHNKNVIAVVSNYFNKELQKLQSKVFVFTPYSKIPVFTAEHNEYICSINWNLHNDFVFIDITSRIGVVTSSKIHTASEITTVDYAQEMSILLQNAQSSSEIYKQTNDIDNTDEISGYSKGLDVNSFSSLFENIDSIKLETMFERVMQVIN